MTRTFHLRTVSRAQADLEQRVAALVQCGVPAQLRQMPIPAGYLAFEACHAGRTYEGWVDAMAILRSMYPQISELAWSKVDTTQLIEWTDEEGVLEALPTPDGGWDDIRPLTIVPMSLEQALLIEIDGEMRSWYRGYPQPDLSKHEYDDPRGKLPLSIDFRLGTSTASFRLLKTIETGDVLLIQRSDPVAMIGGKPLCRFNYEGEKIMLEYQLDEFDDSALQTEENDDATQGDEPRTDELRDDEPFKIDELPVLVEFLLHKETMCFSDLRQLYPGSVLSASAEAASKIKIRANGRLVATGQLVQVGEQLAVQVQSVHFASK
ncbi:hypothetical protein WJ69_34240 [Burkholderia ubonensis]|uniref:type III secretion system cytoplasmic ring protein SctQ n=1 Tax=Burkholderia ubonensis TaxID=101571 RepID=UPI000754DE3C|nr:type III secretion system cytoplasmic ring protein SctQ [Burkholderia ubonensis]KVN98518.1 hypothetical protein WJ69_34240 [Burkholderia ubonensis]